MPTLAARNSPATIHVATTATTSTAMTTISPSLEATTAATSSGGGAAAAAASAVTATNSNAATCTFSPATNSDYHHQQQHQQQQQMQLQLNNDHYHHPPPPLPLSHHPGAGYDVTTAAATSYAAFNGNSNLNVANGNHGNNGINVAAAAAGSFLSSHIASGSNKSETSSNAGSIISSAASASIKKITSSVHQHQQQQQQQQLLSSRGEDVVSLGGASSVNSQMSATNTTGSNNNNNVSGNSNGGITVGGNGNNNINSSMQKGSQENLLQNYYNGGEGSDIEGSTPHHTENDDPGDGLGPLPSKWETAYTERGELYFIDHNTGTSHWLDPRLSKFQKKSLEDCGDNELPYGWEKIEDSLYGTYYIDHVNRRTQYENPVLEAKRRAAEQTQKQQHQRPQTPSGCGGGGLNGVGGGGGGLSAALIGPPPPPPVNVDISQRGMQPPPPPPPLIHNAAAQQAGGCGIGGASKSLLPYKFTRNPAEMQGERVSTTLLKSARGLGITIVGGDDSVEEFLQIKSIVPHGPAWLDGQLQTGDILVYVNDTCVLGFTHHEMVNVFQSILPGETATLEVCRGYPLPFDPNDPNTEVVTTIAVDGISSEPEKQRRLLMDLNMDGNYNFLDNSGGESNSNAKMDSSGFILMKKPPSGSGGGGSLSPAVHTFSIVKGAMGFGFTIADSAYGQKVKKILDRNCCTHLQEGDILLEINETSVRHKTHLEVVQVLKECSKTQPTVVKIQRTGAAASNNVAAIATTAAAATAAYNSNGGPGNVAKLRKNFISSTAAGLFRSKTPTADLYSTQAKEILPIRPKTPLVDTRRARVQTPNNELNSIVDDEVAAATTNGVIGLERSLAESSKSMVDAGGHKSTNSLQEIDAINQEIPFMDPYPKLVTSLSERLAEATLLGDSGGVGALGGASSRMGYHNAHNVSRPNYENQEYVSAASQHSGNYNPIYGLSPLPMPTLNTLHHQHHPQQQQHGGAAQYLHHHHNTSSAPLANTLSSHQHTLYAPPPSHTTPLSLMTAGSGGGIGGHHENCYCYDCQDYRGAAKFRQPSALNYYASATPLQAAHIQNERMQKRVNELLSDRRKVGGFSPLEAAGGGGGYTLPHSQQQQQQHSPAVSSISQQPSVSWGVGGGNSNNITYNNNNTLQPAVLSASALLPLSLRNGMLDVGDDAAAAAEAAYELSEITLERQALGFGFRIVGGTEEGSQVTVGHVVPGGAADNDHRIETSDEILSIDGVNVVNSSHHKVVSLMGEAALRGQVTMILRRRTARQPQHLQHPQQHLQHPHPLLHHHHPHQLQQQQQQQQQQHQMMSGPPPQLRAAPLPRYPYDVIVSRHEQEGFGFVIISSSNQFYGSTIGKLIPGSPADRCGELKVGDRIIAVNRIDIAGMSHGDVVNLIKESGLHVRLTIGCPKEGGGVGVGAGNGGSLVINSAQASPGQVSQHAPATLQQQQQLHSHQNEASGYFERPPNAAIGISSSSNSPAMSSGQQQQQQLLQPPPQL